MQSTLASAILAPLTILAGVAASSAALGQDQVTWRCTAENGDYSENQQPISPRVHTLSGRIQFQSGQLGDQWNPVAHVAFTDSGLPTNADCFCNGLRAAIYPAEPDIVKFFMTFNGQSELIAQASVGKPITFKLSIDDASVLTVVVGKTSPITKTARLAHPHHDLIHMSCSSGDVSFLNVRAEE